MARDTIAPTAAISLSNSTLTAGQAATTTIKFSESVTGLSLTDFTAENGTLSNLADKGSNTWTATFTPYAKITDTSNVIALKASSYTDLAGNLGKAATSSNYSVDTKAASAPKVYWCARDLQATGLGNHHFIWIDGDSSAIQSETYFTTNRPGFVIGATDVNGYLTAYGSNSYDDIVYNCKLSDHEAIKEYLNGSTIGWTNEDLQVKEIPLGNMNSDVFITSLIKAWNNDLKYPNLIDYDLGGRDLIMGQYSGNCASWVNSILDFVGFPLTNNFGDFSTIDWGENHLINLSVFR